MLVAADADGDERWRYRPPGTDQLNPAEIVLGPDASEEQAREIRDEFGLEDGYTTLYGYPVVVDGLAIVPGIGETGGDGPDGLFAVDAETGEEEWAVPVDEGGFAPVAAGETIYLSTSSGVDVVSTDGTHRGRVDLGDSASSFVSSPALGEGRLFVRTREGIVALG